LVQENEQGNDVNSDSEDKKTRKRRHYLRVLAEKVPFAEFAARGSMSSDIQTFPVLMTKAATLRQSQRADGGQSRFDDETINVIQCPVRATPSAEPEELTKPEKSVEQEIAALRTEQSSFRAQLNRKLPA
jgi:hypothetical protein